MYHASSFGLPTITLMWLPHILQYIILTVLAMTLCCNQQMEWVVILIFTVRKWQVILLIFIQYVPVHTWYPSQDDNFSSMWYWHFLQFHIFGPFLFKAWTVVTCFGHIIIDGRTLHSYHELHIPSCGLGSPKSEDVMNIGTVNPHTAGFPLQFTNISCYDFRQVYLFWTHYYWW